MASPAVRRRRRALAGIALVAAVVGAILGGRTDEDEVVAEARGLCDAPGAPLERVAGQGVIVRMEARATAELRRQARAGAIGGVILFPPPEVRGERLASELARIQRAAARGGNPPLLVTIDQEGGAVERLPALPPQISPQGLAQNDDRRGARVEARATGFQLLELGINVNLAPVLDVPAGDEHFLAPRAFGTTPQQVTRLGLAFAAGLRREGVAATAKHFPGLGQAAENTDLAPTTVPGGRASLASDLEPFSAAIGDGIDLVMVSSAVYPGLGSGLPASLAPEVATGLLRDELGFAGVAITDDLNAPAITAARPLRRAAILATAGGMDALLFASGVPGDVARTLAKAAGQGRIQPASLRTSCARVVALRERLAAGGPLPPPGAVAAD